MKQLLDTFIDLLQTGPPGLFSRGEMLRLSAHVADGVAGAEAIAASSIVADGPLRLIDIGSGGGVPGIPLAATLPNSTVTLVESQQRKAAFLQSSIESLQLASRVTVCAERIEAIGQPGSELRESWDVGTARALATPAVVAEYLSPLIRPGGLLATWTTRKQLDVLDAVAAAIMEPLGLGEPQIIDMPTELREGGVLLCWPKVAPCNERYPRRIGVASKRPLA